MTTTITVKTHSWPVKVTQIDEFTRAYGGTETRNVTETVLVVPPNSERSFHITDTRSIAFEELELNKSLIDPIEEAARVAGVNDAGTVRTEQQRLADEEYAKARVPDPDGEEIDPALRA